MMKKRISTILAVVLTIALLASSFVMFGVHADDPATETITIGGNDYEIYTDKKFAAYDSMVAALNGMTPATSDFKNAPVVSFANTDWVAQATGLWAGGALATPRYISATASGPYASIINFYPGNGGFGQSGITVYDGKLYVNAANSWAKDEVYDIQLKYTVKEDGDIVLYDTNGAVSAPGNNTSPYWAWLSGDSEQWATFAIYKNDTMIWPKAGANNKIAVAGGSIEFPDLGTIKVVAGDVISVKVEASKGNRTGIFVNPAIAYAKVDTTTGGGAGEPVETEDITIGGNTYTIEKAGKYNAYDTLKAATSELDATKFTAINLSSSVWQAKISKWNGSYVSQLYYGPAHYSSYPAFMTAGKIDWQTQQNTATVVLDAQEYLAVSPFVKDDHTACAFIDLEFKAPKSGKILIYDVLGAVKAPTANDASPYWAWLKNHVNKIEVTILKNGAKIWPADDSVDNFISDINDSVAIPDLGEIEVVKGETITLRLQEVNNKTEKGNKLPSRDVVYTDIEVAYIYDPNAVQGGGQGGESIDPNKETITVGNNSYNVLKDSKSDLYKGFTAITDGLADKSEVKFTNNWSYAYKYTNDVDFGKSPWKQDLKYVTGIPYYSITDKGTGSVTYKGIYPDSTLSLNSWHNCMFLSSATLIPEMEALYISPACDSLKENKIAEEVWGPALKITYTSDKTGKAVLYDTTGIFSGDVAKAPYWANENANAKTKIEIYKNGTKIWPTDADVVITNTNKIVAFPDLGELDLKIGDKIDFLFYGNPEAPSTRTGVICNPAIAFTEVTSSGKVPQTDANYAADVMVLVSVIAVLGAVVIAGAFIAKKRAHN